MFIVVGVFQWSVMQIGQDSSIDIPHIILCCVFDVIGHIICIFQIVISGTNADIALTTSRVFLEFY